MKLLAAVLLVCLLVSMMAPAGALSVGSAGVSKAFITVNATPAHQITKIPGAMVPVTIVTGAPHGMIEVYSDPSGATITLNGISNPVDKTPLKYSEPPGIYTVEISLSGYKNYTETFYLASGAIKDINANLVKKTDISVPGARVSLAASDTRRPAVPTTLVRVPDALTYITRIPVPVTTTPTITMVCPNSDWSCLTEDEAAEQFGYPNARYGDEACGFVPVDNIFVYKYCFMDVDSGGVLPGRALAATGIRDGDNIYILNETWIAHGVVKKPSGTAPLQSFFDFFNGILSGSSKPESRLDIVGFNPQPEPPGKGALGVLIDPQSRLERVGLNPQPEPPAQEPQVQNAK